MSNWFVGSLREAFRDRHRKYVTVSLLVAGITLIVIGQQAAGRGPAMPQEPPDIEAVLVTKDRHGHCYLRTDESGYKVGRGQKYDIECVVSDTGFELFYEWLCEDGEIAAQDGSMITWVAPNTSTHVTVTVTVSDAAGHAVSEDIAINVVSCSVCTFGRCP
ncbi:MAG: hypothetical protein IBX67_00645 [Dehalococcoidia bacterium]|nr:hypothetical protein [Dehalococcoidia bacterium]